MTITVETGSIVTGANSYVSRADYISWALQYGVTIASAEAADVELRKAAEFIGAHEEKLKGTKTTRNQPLAFPRNGIILEGFSWASTEIPWQLITCQLAIALDIHAGMDPYNPSPNPNRAKKSERVEGAVTVEYFGTNGGTKMGRSSSSTALLNCLLRNNGLFLIELTRI